jgi:hypothetical protein
MAQQTWERIFRAEDVDEKVKLFIETVTHMLDMEVPVKTIRVHNSDKPWMTSHIKMEIKARQRAFIRGDSINYTRLCHKVSSLISKAKIVYYESKAKDHRKSNSSKWFNYPSAQCSLVGMDGTSNLPANGCQNYDLSELTEKLQAVFTAPWNGMMLDNAASYDLNNVQHHLKEIDHPIPSVGQVKKAINALKVKKVTGIDGIPALFLKQYSEDLAPVAHNIITSNIIQCKYPTLYKQALITPGPKIIPPKNIQTDFRQISVLPQLAKVLEKIQLQLNCADLTLKDNKHALGRGPLAKVISVRGNPLGNIFSVL